VDELSLLDPIPSKEKKQLDKFLENRNVYEKIIKLLKSNISDVIYKRESEFLLVIKNVLRDVDKKLIEKIVDGLSEMDKTAEIHRDRNGKILYDKTTKDTEIVKYNKDIDEYMQEEVLPHVPDAHYEFEEDLNAKKPVIKTGAEIQFSKYFYEYQKPEKAEDLLKQFMFIEKGLSSKINSLLEEV